MDDVVVVGQPARGRRQPQVAAARQHHVLGAEAQLVVRFVAGQTWETRDEQVQFENFQLHGRAAGEDSHYTKPPVAASVDTYVVIFQKN